MIEKMEDYAKVLYENIDSVSQIEIAHSLQRVYELAKNKNSNAIVNQMIFILNDVFDAFPPQETNEALSKSFSGILENMERHIKNNIHSMSMELLTNAAYYYCKFQSGSNGFWQSVED
jgi:hypothetical protein